MKDIDKKQDEMMSRRDMLKRVASYTVFTAVTMHVLSPRAQAQGSGPSGIPTFPPGNEETGYGNDLGFPR